MPQAHELSLGTEDIPIHELIKQRAGVLAALHRSKYGERDLPAEDQIAEGFNHEIIAQEVPVLEIETPGVWWETRYIGVGRDLSGSYGYFTGEKGKVKLLGFKRGQDIFQWLLQVTLDGEGERVYSIPVDRIKAIKPL